MTIVEYTLKYKVNVIITCSRHVPENWFSVICASEATRVPV
jgi:hypothetical protein